MSIATRLEAIEEHLTDDYSVLELAGADLTNVDKNIVNLKPTWKERLLYFINNGTEEVWNNWDKVGGEGTSLTLNNTVEAPMKVLLKGNTYQEGTPTPDSPQEVHVVSGDNTIQVRANSNLQSAEQLYQRMYDYDSSYVSEVTDGNVSTIRFESGRYRPTGIGFTFSVLNKYKENTQYTVRATVKKETGTNLFIQALYTDGTTSNTSISGSTTDYTQIRFVTTSGKTVERIGFSFGTSGYWLLDKSSWYVGEGNVYEYPEYKGTTYPINLPEGMFLGSIGDYKDTFFKAIEGNPIYDSLDSATKQTLDSNEWYLEKKINKVVLNGSEEWFNDGGGAPFALRIIGSKIFEDKSKLPNCFANFFHRVIYNDDWANYDSLITTSAGSSEAGRERIKIRYTAISGLLNFQTWLGSNNLELYYVLATPTYTKIEGTLASQLEEVYTAKSEEGQTNISQMNDDLPFILDVSALKQI